MTDDKKKITVLFAEDHPGDRIPIVDYLEATNKYEVISVVNPQQAMKCLERYKSEIDILVLDLVMPDNNPEAGERVLKFMKEKGIRVPYIIASAFGYDGPAERVKNIHKGMWRGTLTKTFLPTELVEMIEAALNMGSHAT